MSFAVSEAPVFAIHGGYEGEGAAGVTGTYAGVMIPIKVTAEDGAPASLVGSNSLGLFTLGVPNVGVGSGVVVIFTGEQQMAGNIQAIPDPNNVGSIVGVLNATGSVTIGTTESGYFFNFDFNASSITGRASGELEASVSNSTNSNSYNGINLDGTCNVLVEIAQTGTNGVTQLFPSSQIEFAVDGFQQSATATSSSLSASGT